MNFTFETLIFILLSILILFSVRKGSDKNILSLQNCNDLKGIFALLILIFHVSKEDDLLFPLFDYFSVVVVGAFFFLSGFGSTKQFISKEDYSKDYVPKRLVRLVLPYIIMTCVYWAYNAFIGNVYSLSYVLDSIIHYRPIVMYSWFIVSIIYHYVLYYLMMLVSKRNRKIMLYLNIFFLVLAIALCLMNRSSKHLVNIMFAAGVIYAFYEKEADGFIRKNRIGLLIASLVLSICVQFSPVRGLFNEETFHMIEKFLFMLMIVSFYAGYHLENVFISQMGKISMEIYMCQGLAKMITRRYLGGSLFIQDLVIFILAIMLSYGFHVLFGYLDRILLSKRKQF